MIRILTDSTADFSMADAAALGVAVVPLTVSFGDAHYQDGIDLPLHVFFMVTHLFCGGKPARQAFFVQVRACFAQLAPERLQRRAGVCIIKMRPRDKHKQRGRGC